MHITEVLGDEQFEELHLCEECANKYLYEPQQKGHGPKGGDVEAVAEGDEGSPFGQRECPLCGLKFVEFRNTGRLGCPHDYQEFREELVPLLENIHGETRRAFRGECDQWGDREWTDDGTDSARYHEGTPRL